MKAAIVARGFLQYRFDQTQHPVDGSITLGMDRHLPDLVETFAHQPLELFLRVIRHASMDRLQVHPFRRDFVGKIGIDQPDVPDKR